MSDSRFFSTSTQEGTSISIFKSLLTKGISTMTEKELQIYIDGMRMLVDLEIHSDRCLAPCDRIGSKFGKIYLAETRLKELKERELLVIRADEAKEKNTVARATVPETQVTTVSRSFIPEQLPMASPAPTPSPAKPEVESSTQRYKFSFRF